VLLAITDVLTSGRLALSIYLAQTLTGTFILYHWGLGLLQDLPNFRTFSLALAVIGVQLRFGRN
jgi:uncharacterized protein